MADFRDISVVEIDKENFNQLWPSLILAMKNSTFMALDAELSGIGTKKLLFAKCVDDRYKEMCTTAKTRSVISLGLSFFKLQPQKTTEGSPNQSASQETKGNVLDFQVQTFNIMVLCSENYMVEPASLTFLIEHGFDFNKQYATGVSYYRGPDKENDSDTPSLRRLFTEIILSKIPIVLHNALVDLVFMYQSFYTNTPSCLQTFLADLMEIFAGGVYDTKYIAEFKARMPASYLAYVFRKSQRINCKSMYENGKYVSVQCLNYPASISDAVVVLPCSLDDAPEESQVGKFDACMDYGAHGWCKLGNSCPYSHDIDIILNSEDKLITKKQKKRQKKMKQKSESKKKKNVVEDSTNGVEDLQETAGDVHSIVEETDDTESVQDNDDELVTVAIDKSQDSCTSAVRKTGGHRAGFDSFMTGFAFATFISRYGKCPADLDIRTCTLNDLGVEDFINKVTLSGKDIPLLIQKGNFAKNSKDHIHKFNAINRVHNNHKESDV